MIVRVPHATQGQDPDHRIPGGRAAGAAALAEHREVRRGVRAAQDAAVHRGDQPVTPEHPGPARTIGPDRDAAGLRPAEQVEQRPQRRDPDPDPRGGQRARTRHRHSKPVEPRAQPRHTCPNPISVNNPAASSRYTTTRDGSIRSRCCTAPVSPSAASTISKGTIRVNSPR
jgi:hypothetical protein